MDITHKHTVIFRMNLNHAFYRFVHTIQAWKRIDLLTEDEQEEYSCPELLGDLFNRIAWLAQVDDKPMHWEEADCWHYLLIYDVDKLPISVKELGEFLQRLEDFFNSGAVIPAKAPFLHNYGSEERSAPKWIYPDPTCPVPVMLEKNQEWRAPSLDEAVESSR